MYSIEYIMQHSSHHKVLLNHNKFQSQLNEAEVMYSEGYFAITYKSSVVEK